MQINLLEKVVGDVTGKSASGIVKSLYGKKNVNEFLIAKRLQLTINQTRNILYKLSDAGLVSFSRKKDKRKGWYTYFWTLDIEKCLIFLKDSIDKMMAQYQGQLKSREDKRFYICKTCGIEVNEENALLNDFACKECGVVYELHKDEKVVSDIKSKVNKFNKDLEIINTELGIIRVDNEKKKVRRDIKEKKEKDLERQKARKKRQKEKDKLNPAAIKVKKKKRA